jgi:hypothetical protein
MDVIESTPEIQPELKVEVKEIKIKKPRVYKPKKAPVQKEEKEAKDEEEKPKHIITKNIVITKEPKPEPVDEEETTANTGILEKLQTTDKLLQIGSYLLGGVILYFTLFNSVSNTVLKKDKDSGILEDIPDKKKTEIVHILTPIETLKETTVLNHSQVFVPMPVIGF